VTRVLAVGYVLSALATALAWLVCRHRVEHRPIALLLTLGLTSDIVRRLLHVFILAPAHARTDPGPLVAGARGAYHVEQALFLAWPAALVAAVLTVFLKRRPWLIGIAWVVAIAGLALTYPEMRSEALRRAYLGVELATIAISLGAMIQWGWAREWPTLTHGILMAFIGAEIAVVWGPWRSGPFFGWTAAQIMYAVTYFVVTILQGGVSWKHSRQS
jgi:hypothetical protein